MDLKMITVYCDVCLESQPFHIHEMKKDPLNENKIWADMACSVCHLIICTFTSDEEGFYEIKKC